MPKLQAAVPTGAPPNALLRVRLPDGSEVNVRVPEGLSPGDEFIFEVSSIGEITATGGLGGGNNSGGITTYIGTNKNYLSGGGVGGGGRKGSGSGKASSSRNPKKRRSNNNSSGSGNSDNGAPFSSNGRDGGDHQSSSSHHSNNNNGAGVPSFITGFFNMYNQVYDILSQNNAPSTPASSAAFSPSVLRQSSQISRGKSNNNVATPTLSRQGSRGKSNDGPNGTITYHQALAAIAKKQQPQQQPYDVATPSVGLLDRELYSSGDFLAALAVGMFIGLSVVVGFLLGVLYVTPVGRDEDGLSNDIRMV